MDIGSDSKVNLTVYIKLRRDEVIKNCSCWRKFAFTWQISTEMAKGSLRKGCNRQRSKACLVRYQGSINDDNN